MNVLAVIVNYKTPDLVAKALRELVPQLRALGGCRAVVVDNDSRDGSFERIRTSIDEQGLGDIAEVVASGKNGGFGFGNNLAIRPALRSSEPPRFVYLMNPDAWPESDAVASLVRHMEAEPDVGIAGSRILSPAGAARHSCFRFPTLASEVEGAFALGVLTRLLKDSVVSRPIPDRTCDTDWVSGASFMARSAMLERVGLFDEGFFLYFEEVDLCRRARDAGWRSTFVSESVVRHHEAAATGLDAKRAVPSYYWESRRRYFSKHHGEPYVQAANLARIVGYSTNVARGFLERRPRTPPRVVRDFIRHSVLGPKQPR